MTWNIVLATSSVILMACDRSVHDSIGVHVIALDSIASLGYQAGPYSPTVKSEVAWLPGKYVLSNTYVPGEIAILDEEGRFLKGLGSKGEGPGEFLQIDGIATDTIRHHIHIMDTQNGRITAIDTTGTVITESSIRLFADQIEVLPTHEYVIHPLRDRSTAGLPARIVAKDTVFELGYDERNFRNNARLAVDATGGIWISRYDRYEIIHYSKHGAVIRTIRRSPDWFHRFDPVRLGRQGGKATVIEDIAIDEGNRLWILITEVNVTRDMLRKALANRSGERRPEAPSVAKQFTHSRIEVLDAQSGSLIASHNAVDHLFHGFVKASVLYELADDTNGVIGALVWRINLTESH